MRFKWKCELCGSVQVSDTEERHTPTYCKCGKTMVDAEEYHTRTCGAYKYLGEE